MQFKKMFMGLLFSFGVMVNGLFALTIDTSTIVGKTLYFASANGVIGERTYSNDGNYTGELTLSSGTVLDLNGTYTISDDTLTLQRTSPTTITIVLTYLGAKGSVTMFETSINDGLESYSFYFTTETERDNAILDPDMDGFSNLDETIANTNPADYNDNPFTATLIDKTTYFAGYTGESGERTYNSDGNYTGTISSLYGPPIDVNGTYAISGKVITLYRSTGAVLELTYLIEDDGGIAFNESNVIDTTLSYVFRTIEERDAIRDFDDDGMNDEYEILYGLDPEDPADAALDLDVDGFTNLEEYEGETNATNASNNPLTVAIMNNGMTPIT